MADDHELSDDHRALIEELLAGDDLALSRIISHVENREPGYRAIVDALADHTDDTRTIGITGPPGAGKSTIVDRLVEFYRGRSETVGVVAIDPASPYSGGSVLGDRIRQQSIADDGVFFRSMSARNRSGGLATATFDAIKALNAYGKDVILVETVGSGQSEVDIVQAADTVCVVLFPGAGDDIQADKAGILEIADVFAVNKADLNGADEIATRLQEMLKLGDDRDWKPPIQQTVATGGSGVEDLVASFDDHYDFLLTNNRLDQRRNRRFERQAELYARERLINRLNSTVTELDLDDYPGTPHAAADKLLENF